MKDDHPDAIRQRVRGRYAEAASGSGCGCRPETGSGCCKAAGPSAASANRIMGYSSKELVSGWFPGSGAENYVASTDIVAVKGS